MDAIPAQKPQISSTNKLEIAFFVSQKEDAERRSQKTRENNEVVRQIKASQPAEFKKIDEILLSYSHHYAKDIESNFPDVQLGSLQICPKIITHSWQIKTKTEWRQRQQQNENDGRYWLPIFLSEGKPDKYFEDSLQLIAIILQINSLYQGFLGYIPGSLQILQVIQSLCNFYEVNLEKDTMFLSHLKGEYMSVADIENIKVKQMAGSYIKICPPSHERIISQLQQIKDEENSFNFVNNSMQREANYNLQSLATNQGGDLAWMSDMDIETCQPQKQVRLKLITIKNEQQLYKLKLRTKLIIDHPSIQIPNDSQQMIAASLNAIVQELKNDDCLKN